MHCLKCMFLLPQRNKPMSVHAFYLLQTKLCALLLFCVVYFSGVSTNFQQMGNHLLCLFLLIMLFCAVAASSSSIFFSLRHFSHLSHSCIKTCHSSVHSAYTVLSHILIEMTWCFSAILTRSITEKWSKKPRAQLFLFSHIKSYFLKNKVILSSF